ncbi:hypothetical protein MVES1_004015 [Malassezia vespertilionis]|uniref:Septicolysin n=1 Tax=Malassezia vespertilionis TaxID=2020962 RepID=A0A2N1J7T2_9BASI|nr:uncharacterized protein MVES1_004015 [Malassezia vespertilionis]PKI82522.1 hypothetical protein MVES_003564 [Malassezia vespertilionis]WFD08638.1 hypothetical protein MVES1_004015 [Malassezia vespertilionis]
MKLAEALAERAEAQQRYERIRARLNNVAKIQEDDEPAEDSQELLREAEKLLDRMQFLIRRINRTNLASQLSDEETITDAIARRDILHKRRKLYSDLATQAGSSEDRYSRSELRYVATVNVRDLQKKVDLISKEYRQLDTDIQKANWQVDLL